MKKTQPRKRENAFSHLSKSGDVRMVDVGGKPVQRRVAVAIGEIHCKAATLLALKAQALPKGDVLATARIAGIQAAKRTAELIPLCHALPLDKASVDFTVKRDRIEIRAEAVTHAKTGVEMEALTAVSVAALTLYDMMKAVDKTMRIDAIRLLEKSKE
jgi:cyclic pyranopterin monophosphate synthase